MLIGSYWIVMWFLHFISGFISFIPYGQYCIPEYLIFVVQLVAVWRYSPGVHRAIHDGTHRAR